MMWCELQCHSGGGRTSGPSVLQLDKRAAAAAVTVQSKDNI